MAGRWTAARELACRLHSLDLLGAAEGDAQAARGLVPEHPDLAEGGVEVVQQGQVRSAVHARHALPPTRRPLLSSAPACLCPCFQQRPPGQTWRLPRRPAQTSAWRRRVGGQARVLWELPSATADVLIAAPGSFKPAIPHQPARPAPPPPHTPAGPATGSTRCRRAATRSPARPCAAPPPPPPARRHPQRREGSGGGGPGCRRRPWGPSAAAPAPAPGRPPGPVLVG